ncbi:hypothetical protein NC653_031811 [Populus alba x Populus x berolinensis]|uniref:Uncharacterized protein n=1 Tax=Populus alba x Populus x berolinensis TaxID=444605 RepID=A0AAD6M0F9_9ROSI|nr:hypothetical protein NC653_031811 [Populus alba x Populus x berolinensis]
MNRVRSEIFAQPIDPDEVIGYYNIIEESKILEPQGPNFSKECIQVWSNFRFRYIDLSLMQFVKDLGSTASIETPNFLSRMPTSFSKNTDSLEPISTALDSPLV